MDFLRRRRSDGALLDHDAYVAELESIEAEVDKDPPVVFDTLPAYDHDAPCPKCRFAAGTTRYHHGNHTGCTVRGAPGDPFPFGRGMGTFDRRHELNVSRMVRRAAAVPEHIERQCPNCAYQWAEGIAPDHAATA